MFIALTVSRPRTPSVETPMNWLAFDSSIVIPVS